MTGVLIGAFIVALIWACRAATNAENRARRGERQLWADSIDTDAKARAWSSKTFGGSL